MLAVRTSRRSFLRVGALALGGLTLPHYLRLRAAQPAAPRKKAVILIWQAGGPSHIDMYDLKPDAPAEVRGEFKPIPTVVPGVQIGEHLPLQARAFDKLAVVRSAFHTNAGHGMGSQWMQTGYQATIEVNDNIYPSTGSVVARMIGTTNALGEYPTSKPYAPGCVLSTMYHVLGIDHKHVFHDDARRPLPILGEGAPIRELVG
ncbi:MAG: DUF1501 domain-containing protein [Gemmataceae bacterium]|nr:DUF1501 domain-containing protein [Gemmataceae bacterium]